MSTKKSYPEKIIKNICMATSYYSPYISGLTLYFQRLAEEYAERGYEVIMITSRHDFSLPHKELIQGVHVIRTPIIRLFSKAYIAPRLVFDCYAQIRQADVVHLNLPSLESLVIVLLAKLLKKKIVATYVCDIQLPPFPMSAGFTRFLHLYHRFVLYFADAVTTYTSDFALHSPVLSNIPNVISILPPTGSASGTYRPIISQFKEKYKIGMATRVSSEKGIEHLIDAIPMLESLIGHDFRIVIAGNQNPPGENQYVQNIISRTASYKDRITFLGQLPPSDMASYLKDIDVLVVASTNSTEAFGLIQIEAMREGTPVVATNLPGVRIPIRLTQMGIVVPLANPEALAKAVAKICIDKHKYNTNKKLAQSICTPEVAADEYLELYEDLLNDLK